MFDLRPVAYVIGWLVAVLGATMLVPLVLEWAANDGHWPVFLTSAFVTMLVGGLIATATANTDQQSLSVRQTFMLTTGVWVALPIFGALPFWLGPDGVSYTDAFFEAMSGLTTTGATVLTGLDTMPPGVLLWRGLLQWFGGIGIIVVAMVFLPELRIGGMQIFRSEGFDTQGKILPRATEIAQQISVIYVGLTVICALVYGACGMDTFDAIIHAMTTIATGGFANYDASFGAFGFQVEYAASLFMILAALPFVRYVQFLAGSARPLFQDAQVRTFLWIAFCAALMITTVRLTAGDVPEEAFRKALFNTVSILTGTGYASTDYMLWGAAPVAMIFFIGLIGGCAGSTSCSVKVFRYQLLFSAIRAQILRIQSPHGIFQPRYAGRPVSEDVLSSVMAFFLFFIVGLGVLAVLLGLTGLDFTTSVSGAAAALANIGPGLGPEIGPAGNYAGLGSVAKWLLSAGMLIGRLELLVVFALLTRAFWLS